MSEYQSTVPAASNRLPVLAEEITRAVADARRHAGATVVSAIEAGEKLVEAKSQLPHGAWLAWLKDNCDLSDRTARVYMRLAKHKTEIDMKSAAVADLTIRGAADAIANNGYPFGDSARWADPVARIGFTRVPNYVLAAVPSLKNPGFYWMACALIPHDFDFLGIKIDSLRRPIKACAVDWAVRKFTDQDDYLVSWEDVPRSEAEELFQTLAGEVAA